MIKLVDILLTEKWTNRYKKSINCSNPKGFSQKAHCAGHKFGDDWKSYLWAASTNKAIDSKKSKGK